MKKRIAAVLLCAALALPVRTAPLAFAAEPVPIAYVADGETDGGTRMSASDWDDIDGITVSDANDENDAIEFAIGITLVVARYFGITLLVWGFIKYFQAVSCGHPQARNIAVMSLVTGAFLFGLTAIFRAMGLVV